MHEPCFTCGHDEDDHGPVCSVCYEAVGGLACAFYVCIAPPSEVLKAAAELYADENWNAEGSRDNNITLAFIAGAEWSVLEEAEKA